jgi:transcriptional regulator with XRE-family HTH domain
MIDVELGTFIRQRREALSPATVGLPIGTRRRTPGLRRAELATLAGISVDYLIRIEQGRDRNPSAQVLAALADALQLSEADLDVIRAFSIVNNGAELCPAAIPAARAVRPTVQTLLDRLEPSPAVVINRLSDALAWTEGYERLVRPLGLLDAEQPNMLSFTFTDERSHTVYPDWAAVADEQIGDFQTRETDELRAFVDRLLAEGGDEFRDRWRAVPASRKRSGATRIVHPAEGELRLAPETMQLADNDDQRLIVYLPGDEATASALDRITGRQPGALRALTG